MHFTPLSAETLIKKDSTDTISRSEFYKKLNEHGYSKSYYGHEVRSVEGIQHTAASIFFAAFVTTIIFGMVSAHISLAHNATGLALGSGLAIVGGLVPFCIAYCVKNKKLNEELNFTQLEAEIKEINSITNGDKNVTGN